MVAIIDYDAGNLGSVEKAVRHLGKEAEITRDPKILLEADHVILPGVGSFADAMEKLIRYDLPNVISKILQKETPFLGICLGEQLLFEGSEESPGVPGLSILPGRCRLFPKKEGMKVPQIGWNALHICRDDPILAGIPEGSFVYFVHSYYVESADPGLVVATTDYSAVAHVIVARRNLYGLQFHPEKSGGVGLTILRNFLELSKGGERC